MRRFQMLQAGLCLPAVPGFTEPAKSYAPWKVWRGSTTLPVKFAVVSKTDAARLYHRARDFERRTRQPGRQDGALGRNGLKVLEALLFDFLNYATGQLDPAYATIAEAAGICQRSVARGLVALKQAGVLFWQRRCKERTDDNGAYLQEQDSNAYSVRPVSQWRGYTGQPEAPPPESGTWGDHPCGTRDAITEAIAEGPDAPLLSVVRQLENDPTDRLAAALASFGRALESTKSPVSTETASQAEKTADSYLNNVESPINGR